MRTLFAYCLLCVLTGGSCLGQETLQNAITRESIDRFFAAHPDYVGFREMAHEFYQHQKSTFWHDGRKLSEFAVLLHESAGRISEEGLPPEVPYQNELDRIFEKADELPLRPDDDMLLTCLYLYYHSKVFGGLDASISSKTGWNLPRYTRDYTDWLSKADKKGDIPGSSPKLFSQYYKLREGLQKYREIAQNGGWQIMKAKQAKLRFGDVSVLVPQLKSRLLAEGYFEGDTTQNLFDAQLLFAVKAYQQCHGLNPTGIVNDALIASLNVPVAARIATIAVNMERCRWISPESENRYLAVNIPSYHLFYFKDGEPVFSSDVVVGKEMTKTVVFSGLITQVVFNPYWNVPASILNKEILPALKKNPNLLLQQEMEWHEGKLRQRPGNKNALGRVKFLFPNSNNIYLHDTPQKKLFREEKRAFSHGCIRVEKACELAYLLMNENFGWTEIQTVEAMQQSDQRVFELKNKLKVYITYFTAWTDEEGQVRFFDDVYGRDKKLAAMLLKDTP